MVGVFTCCSQTIMATGTGHSFINTTSIHCCVVKACDKAAAGLMAILTAIGCRRVRPAFANRLSRIAIGMATHTRLGRNGRVQVINRIGLCEGTGRGMTGITLPATVIHRVMRRRDRRGLVEPGIINRIGIRTIVATTARRSDVGMVECSGGPCHHAVAVAAIGGGRDVARRLAGCLHAIVAIATRTGDT